jgi:hypothetical protein
MIAKKKLNLTRPDIEGFVCSLQRKNTRGHTQSPKLENSAGEGAPVGSSEDEHPETFVRFFASAGTAPSMRANNFHREVGDG